MMIRGGGNPHTAMVTASWSDLYGLTEYKRGSRQSLVTNGRLPSGHGSKKVRKMLFATLDTESPIQALCGKAASTDLRGGPLAREVPTATGGSSSRGSARRHGRLWHVGNRSTFERPRQDRSVRAVAARPQEDRDAVRASQAHSPARSVTFTGPERSAVRVHAGSDRTEPEAARKDCPPTATGNRSPGSLTTEGITTQKTGLQSSKKIGAGMAPRSSSPTFATKSAITSRQPVSVASRSILGMCNQVACV
jgi:hypothetical protein